MADPYNAANYTEQGGARTVIGGSLDVASGGDLDIESGASLKLAGTALTPTAAEVNKLAGVTAGTVTASKAVVVSSNKDIATFRDVTVRKIIAGTNGVGGIVGTLTVNDGANPGSSADLVYADAAKLAGITASATELNALDITAAGAVQASKAVVVDASKDIASFHSLASETLVAGINGVGGVAGSLQVKNGANPGAVADLSYADVAQIDGVTPGTQAAGKCVIADANVNTGVSKVTALHIGATGSEVQVTAVANEINALDGAPLGAASLFTVGAEGGNVINVAIQLKDAVPADLAVRAALMAYLSDDANGDSLATTAPSGGCAIGTDGLLIPVTPALSNALMVDGNLAIDATPEKFKTTQTAAYLVNGVSRTKAATVELTFSAAHVITASKFGCVLIQINAAGTVSTKVAAATQAYDNAPAALAALPAVDAGNVALGYIAIENNAGDWTANTDDLTNASDVTTAAFNDASETAIGAAKAFMVTSESDGDIDINITEAGVATWYLVLVLPNGKLAVSGAITFA